MDTRLLELDWSGCVNVRDLGGLPTERGGETRYGALVRADNVRRLTGDGWRSLVAHGVRTILDLRVPEEVASDTAPPDAAAHLTHVNVSFFDPAGLAVEEDDLRRRVVAAADDASAQADVYLWFLQAFRDNVGAAVREIAHAGEGGVLVHCWGGKDRTGLVVALTLRAVGVPRDVVVHDYQLSHTRTEPLHVAWIEAAADEDERAFRRRIASAPAEAMERVLDHLGRSGGELGYLAAAGVGEGDLAALRARLLG